jgi:hypothetical protein
MPVRTFASPDALLVMTEDKRAAIRSFMLPARSRSLGGYLLLRLWKLVLDGETHPAMIVEALDFVSAS